MSGHHTLPVPGGGRRDSGAEVLNRAPDVLLLLFFFFEVALISSTPLPGWGSLAGYTLIVVVLIALTRPRLMALFTQWLGVGVFVALVSVSRLLVGDVASRQWQAFLVRAVLSAAFVVLWGVAMPFPRFVRALSTLKVPSIFLDVMALTYSYLSVLMQTADRTLASYRLRGGFSGWGIRQRSLGEWWRSVTALGGVAGSLFLRSLEQSDRTYHAMLCRGGTDLSVTVRKSHSDACGWAAVLLLATATIAARFWGI